MKQLYEIILIFCSFEGFSKEVRRELKKALKPQNSVERMKIVYTKYDTVTVDYSSCSFYSSDESELSLY